MKIDGKTYDHIEVFDETGQLIAVVSDTEIIEHKNNRVVLCETEEMFKE